MPVVSFEPMNSYEEARLLLSRTFVDVESSLAVALQQVTRLSGHVLGVERAGVWIFESAGAILRCRCLYVRSKNAFEQAAPLAVMEFPTYLQAIEQRREIVAEDVFEDPFTRELGDRYLRPLGITSMLDAPIYRKGIVAGVACHEHVGPARKWSDADRAFAASTADIVALLYEQCHRLRAERALRESEAKRLELYRMHSLGELAARAAHDFNNALAIIAASADLAEQQIGSNEFLDTVKTAARRASATARDLMAFGRTAEVVPELIDVNAVLSQGRVLFELQVGNDRKLVTSLGAVGLVRFDATQLDRAVANLLGNARDATPSGAVVQLKTSRVMRDDAPFVCIQVVDEGTGIEPATLPRIFEPYFTTKSDRGGTGLGLASVHGLVHQAGGEVEVETKPGAGTTISIFLPIV